MNYYSEIKQELINNELYNKVKDYSKNKNEFIMEYCSDERIFVSKYNLV